ncbi:MAG: MFS transporter [Propionibacteriaceae bacterium]|nr:MFS transporter [Propionibacteriaceae bacterium]
MTAGETGNIHPLRLPRDVWILATVGFLIAIGFGVMSPILPIYARTFGVSSFLIGLVVSSLSILRLTTMPVSSWLLRFIGPREVAIAGCALIGFTTFMIGVSDSYWGIVVWRGLSGFGSALYGVSAMALLFAAAPPEVRGRSNAIYGGGFVLGGMAGPALGGLIVGVSIHAPFFFYAVTLVLAAVVMAVLLPRTPVGRRQQMRDATIGLVDLVKDRRFRAAIVVNFGNGWQSNGVRAMLVPLFITGALHMPTLWAGIAFTIAAVVQACCLPLTGWGTDRLGRRFMLLTGGCATAAISIGFSLAQSYLVLVILMCLYAAGASASSSSAQAMLADTVPVTASSGLAAYQMAGDIGQILGPLVAGATMDIVSIRWAWVFGAAIILVGVGLSSLTAKTIQPPVGSSGSTGDPHGGPQGAGQPVRED